MDKKVIVTASGLEALEKELEQLKTVKRKEISDKIAEARSYGDLSENSEYDEAKNEQAIVEARIADLEVMLKNVVILDESEIVKDVISLGSNVKVYDEDFEEDVFEAISLKKCVESRISAGGTCLESVEKQIAYVESFI